MRTSQKADRSRLIAAAMQKIPCELTIANIQFVNVFTGEVYPAQVDVLDGTVVRVRLQGEELTLPAKETYDGRGAFLIPGFIDTHIHVESTMMIPENMSRTVVPWGTTTVCTDPHEISNVMGLDGVRFMLQNSQKSTLRQYVLSPSCVPSVPCAESTGATFTAHEVGEILDMPDVIGIAEVMDFIGVLNDSKRMHSIIDEGLKRGVYLQGHSPGLHGKELAAYRLGGPDGDHESDSAKEVCEKLRNGIHVNLRASSLIDSLDELVKGFSGHKWRDFVSVCTDDIHASDLLLNGSINKLVRLTIEAGVNPLEAIKFATLNAAREYGFDNLGAIGPGYLADMQLVRNLDGGMPEAVFIMGKLVAQNGHYIAKDDPAPPPKFPSTVQIPQISAPEDFKMAAPKDAGETVLVATLVPQAAAPVLNTLVWERLPVINGYVSIEDREDLCYVCVANRYGSGGKTIALLKRGRCNGAYGTTVAHDCHNLVVLYRHAQDAFEIANAMKKMGGGICTVQNGQLTSTLALPVAGLMSTKAAAPLSEEIGLVKLAIEDVFGLGTSLLHASLLCLACLPSVVVTDFGIVDGLTQEIIQPVKML